jgi:hypothetical protein
MGTFLSTGIVIEMITLKEELKKAEIKNEELFSALEEKFHYNLNIFDTTETDEYLKFTLKDIVFQRELLPFLERLFPIIYGKDEEATKVIENLKAIEPSGWKNLAEKSPLYYYQLSKYGGDDWLYFEKGFDTRIRIKYPSIISLISEGKIIMEVYGKQFRFYKYCLKEAFREFSLASAMRIHIDG